MIQHKIKTKEALAIAKKAPLASLAVFFQRLRQKVPVDYKIFENGWSFYPATVAIYATTQCNLACPMCVDEKLKKRSTELTFPEIRKLIDEIAFFRPIFYITGGECLLRKDVIKIIKYAKKRGLICSLTTNGTLLTQIKGAELINSGIDRISVSLDGPEKAHDLIRGKGSFKKTYEGIKRLQELKKKEKKLLPSIKIATVVTGLNIDSLKDLVKIAKDLEVFEIVLNQMDYKSFKVSQVHNEYFRKNFSVNCYPQGLIYHLPPLTLEKAMMNFKMEELIEKIKKVEELAAKEGIVAYLNPPVKSKDLQKYYLPKFLPQSYCLNSWMATKILPNGEVIPCFYLPMGNIRKEKFKTIWNNLSYRRFRQILKNQKYFSSCIRCCALEV